MLAFAILTVVVQSAEAPNAVGRVVNLLRDMQSKLEGEKKSDAALYEKMSCWCSTNEGEKNHAVDTATQRIEALNGAIEAGVAKSAELKGTLEKLAKDIAKNQEAVAQASALRQKENAAFSADEAELTASLDSVSKAVAALSKHNTGFLQASFMQAEVHNRLLAGAARIGAKAHSTVKAFLQQPADFQSYNSRSGAIFGILSQMKDEFTANLAQSRADEEKASASFAGLKRAKTGEIDAAKQMTVDKTAELAETDEGVATDRHDLELTNKQLTADEAFLVDLRKRCASQDADYAARTKARNAEIAGVNDAIGILTDDAARDLFSKSLSFVQRSRRTFRARTVAVQRMQTGLDGFEKVKGAINKMTEDLKTQQGDEGDKRDWCVKEIRKNENEQHVKEGEIEDLKSTIADHEATIDTLTKEIAQLTEEVEEMKRQIKHASEDREAENKEFQQTVADQRATAQILTKAANRLRETYAESLLQADPPAFQKYEQHSGGHGVIGLIQEIINETNALTDEATKDEQNAQNAYTGFLKESAATIKANRASIAAKSEAKAQREADLVTAKASLRASEETLANLKKYNSELHADCDFVMANFGARQEARQQEMDGLHSALAILSGA